MSTQRRHLVSRSRQNESATPGPSRRGRDSQAPTQQTLSLPPYKPPSCPLSAGAKRKIDELRSGRNFTKYEKHLKGSITAVSDSAAACHERLTARKENLDRQAAKRKKDGIADDEKPQDHVEADNYYRQMANKVKVATKESDKAIRELIDLSDEMRMQDSILREVEENIPDAPPARPARRQRGEDDEDEENEDPEAPAEDPEILSAIELVKKAKENYVTKYQEKSLLKRYGDSNDYRNFKRLVHSAQYPGEEKPPLPKASTWFPEENGNNPEEDSDDDVVIEGSKKSLKCVLTMRYFEEPWANNLCPHVFEKAGFLEYLNGSGASFTGANGQRGEKKVACPQPGCNKMLAESDMYLDKITIREVQRELKKNSREDYNDDDDDDADDAGAPRGTRRDPEQLGSEDDEDNSMDIDDVRQKRMAKFKREKSMGLSQAPPSHQRSESSEPDEDEIEIMNMTQG